MSTGSSVVPRPLIRIASITRTRIRTSAVCAWHLHYGDLTDATNLIRIVQQVQPEEIYNLAAQSHVHVSFETPEYTANSDALGTLRLLEAIRPTSSMPLIAAGHASCCSWARAVFTRNMHPNRFAKIAGLKMCQAYRRQYGFNAISAMPTNLYGPGDNFSLQTSHVLPALLRKIHDAKERGLSEVEVWGTGKPRREFLHVDDLADACVFLMQNYDGDGWINVGWGRDETIAELAQTISRVAEFKGALRFDTSKPDGTPRKLLDTSRLNALGWSPRIELEAGIRSTYEWFLNNREVVKT
jgi:nucleoside-diphosphate-sugar epimerase